MLLLRRARLIVTIALATKAIGIGVGASTTAQAQAMIKGIRHEQTIIAARTGDQTVIGQDHPDVAIERIVYN